MHIASSADRGPVEPSVLRFNEAPSSLMEAIVALARSAEANCNGKLYCIAGVYSRWVDTDSFL